MRDRARQRAKAEAMSHRASPDELRDAGKRVKELEQELLQSVPLQPETRAGRGAPSSLFSRSSSSGAARRFPAHTPAADRSPKRHASSDNNGGRLLYALWILRRRHAGRLTGAQLQAKPDRHRDRFLGSS